MKLKRFLIFFFIFTIIFKEVPQAVSVSANYKQGIYNISETNDFNATAKLITPNNVTSLMIINSDKNQKFYKRFDTVNEVINLGLIKNGDFIVIIGKGEIAVTKSK